MSEHKENNQTDNIGKPVSGLLLSDAQKAEKLLEGNVTNIAKKVLAGTPLTLGEVRILEQRAAKQQASPVAGEPRFAKNQTELAQILGVDRKTIHNWRLRKGSPATRSDGRLDVEAWRRFGESVGGLKASDLDKGALQAEQLLIQNKRLWNKLAIEREEWIPKVVARQVFTQLVTESKSRCFNSIIRIVTLARVAQSTTGAVEEVRRELETVWRSMENTEWFKPITKP